MPPLGSNPYLLIVFGLIAGFVGGLVGIGGGVVLVPILVLVLGYSQQQAQGTQLALIAIPVSFVAAWTYWKAGFVDVKVVVLLAAGFVLGGYAGAKLAIAVPTVLLQRIFGVLLLVVGARLVLFPR